MNRKNYLYLLLIIVSVFFVSCNENTIFSEYTTVDNGVWAKDRSFAFNVEVADTSALYEIDLLVRNTDIFPRQNLWLRITKEYRGQEIQCDTVNLFLLDESGKWTGSGSGTCFDNQFVWKRHIRFYKQGSYIFRIAHLMRFDILEGIDRIGLAVVKEK